MNWVDELRRLLERLRREQPDGMEGGIACQEAAERLYEWMDGELEGDLERAVGTHLETCARCYPVLVFERAFREAVARATGREEAPDELRRRILESLEAEGLGSME
jgi:mycothiol system anti-sigma-R factor